jgi:hypothetical protein
MTGGYTMKGLENFSGELLPDGPNACVFAA